MPNPSSDHHELALRAQDQDGGSLEAFAYSGPLPTPETLAAYGQAIPGAAERILSMAEDEQAHRQAMDRGRLALAQDGQRLDRQIIRWSIVGKGVVAVSFIAGSIIGAIELHIGVVSLALAPFIYLISVQTSGDDDLDTDAPSPE